jgi:P27 family predicted phage terminase small subunit
LKKPTPPRDLTRAARAVWNDLVETYEIDRPAELLLLEAAVRAWDRMTAAAATLAAEGATVKDRWGQPRAHPAAAIERDARAGLVAALKALDLELAPSPRHFGRPGGPMTVARRQELGLS